MRKTTILVIAMTSVLISGCDLKAITPYRASHPDFKEGNVGYHSFSPDDPGNIKIKREELKTVFSPNRALLVEMIIKHHQSKQAFEFKRV